MQHLILPLCLIFSFTSLSAQESMFYVSKRYAKHVEQNRKTGRSEVAFFGVSLTQKDSCWVARQYRGINNDALIYPDYVKIQRYYWNKALKKYTATCERQMGGGLFRHQHTEGEDWLFFGEADQLFLKRCGYAKAVNTLVQADSSQYFITSRN